MDNITIHGFKLLVSQNEFAIEGSTGGKVLLLPAEVADFRELVGTVWRMTSLPAMPDKVPSGANLFTATINNKDIEIQRNDRSSEVFKFHESECDWLVEALDAGLNKMIDMFKLNPQPRATGAFTPGGNFHTDVFEGRN